MSSPAPSRPDSPPPEFVARLRARAEELGLIGFGIARPDPSRHGEFLDAWLAAGYEGEMGWLARPDAVARRADLRKTMREVRSVVVVADPYDHGDPPEVPDDPSIGVIARYARGRDYHKVLDGKLRALLRWIEEACDGEVAGRVHVDTGPVLERELAERAGLGWFGRNTMLIHPDHGSYVFLGVLLLDLELPATDDAVPDRCGSCSACIEACPTDALLGRDEEGAPVMDARRCISYLTIEHRGPIPEALRPAIGNRIYGCDICQEVCPWNLRFGARSAEPDYAARGPGERPHGVQALPGDAVPPRGAAPPGEPAVPSGSAAPGEPAAPSGSAAHGETDVPAETSGRRDAHPGTEAPSLVELMRMTPEGWEAFSRGSAIRRAGYAGFRRNVAVALGNWLASVDDPPEAAVAVLRDALEDESEVVREHAAWALERA
ncbi:MAG: tRNA epoxyqueuosine(34) reductase QueG [Longimicrobiales bacterium]|nr:tRNA epoxyqueuosine(34) reductase QueG [Longimicrobiales bacterium]